MEKSQLDAMKCNINGIIMGIRDQILKEVDENADDYHNAIQALASKGNGFDQEEISNQFNQSYEEIVNNFVRLTALSIIDKDDIKMM